MSPSQILDEAKKKISAATAHLQEELKKLRTGQAHPNMLDSVMVEAYGQQMPLKSLASITAPEPQLLQISPFDPNNLQAIADGIRNDQSLDLTPTDDGRVVRVSLPPMTSENRQNMVKLLNQKLEECLISARNARHDGMQAGWKAEQERNIGKDDFERLKKQLDELIEHHKKEVEAIAKAKETEILTV